MPNISRRKGNQAITFGQLIEYNKRNMFLEKSPSKCLGVASPKPFHIKSKFGISLKRQSEMFYGLFLLYVQVVVYQNILKLKCWPLAFTLNKVKKKKKRKKRGLDIFTYYHFLHDFWRKIFLTFYSINWLNFIDCPYMLRYWEIRVL